MAMLDWIHRERPCSLLCKPKLDTSPFVNARIARNPTRYKVTNSTIKHDCQAHDAPLDKGRVTRNESRDNWDHRHSSFICGAITRSTIYHERPHGRAGILTAQSAHTHMAQQAFHMIHENSLRNCMTIKWRRYHYVDRTKYTRMKSQTQR